MLSIGAFARLAGVSVKTLRHYASVGLLSPARIDPETGYRFYAPEQLFLLNHILVLKDLGLSLTQIGALLQEGVPLDQLHGMLRLKRAELHDQIDAAHELLARVERRLEQLELRALPLSPAASGPEQLLPMVILGGFVLLPGVTVPMEFSAGYSSRAIAHAAQTAGRVLVVCLDATAVERWGEGEPTPLPALGVVAATQEFRSVEDDGVFVQLDVQARAAVGSVTQTAPFFLAACRELVEPLAESDTRVAALMATVRTQMTTLLVGRGVPADVLAHYERIEAPGRLADVAGYLPGTGFAAQHAVQQQVDPLARLELVAAHLARLLDEAAA